MTSRRIAMLLLAFGLPSAPAFAQAADEPAPKHGAASRHDAVPGKAHAKRPPKPGGRASAAPAVHAPILGSGGEDDASSLERRRKAFFATKPDEGGAEGASPSAGVTLGGSGGISPGMGFKF